MAECAEMLNETRFDPQTISRRQSRLQGLVREDLGYPTPYFIEHLCAFSHASLRFHLLSSHSVRFRSLENNTHADAPFPTPQNTI